MTDLVTKNVMRIKGAEVAPGTSLLSFNLKDGSQLILKAIVHAPKIEASGPPGSFAREFKNDVTKVKITTDEIIFVFTDGQEFPFDISQVGRHFIPWH